MKNGNDINLSLIGEDLQSDLKFQIYKEELNEINNKYPIEENQVDIKKTYLIKNNDSIEVGFFIRNCLNNSISFEHVVLVIQDEVGKNLLTKSFNFKEQGNIPPFSARPFTVSFELDDSVKFDDEANYSIKFDNVHAYKAFSSVSTKIENIPIDISYEEEQEIRNFVGNLETLRHEEFTISLYRLSYQEDNSVMCVLFLRNGSEKDARLERLPITIISEQNVFIARKVFIDEVSLTKISPMTSKFVYLTFHSYEFPAEKIDLTKCTVIFK